MSPLPEWIQTNGSKILWDLDQLDHRDKLLEALAIAWEALEYAYGGRTIKEPGMSVQSRPLSKTEIQIHCDRAMRRIEELGKETV